MPSKTMGAFFDLGLDVEPDAVQVVKREKAPPTGMAGKRSTRVDLRLHLCHERSGDAMVRSGGMSERTIQGGDELGKQAAEVADGEYKKSHGRLTEVLKGGGALLVHA